LGDLGIYMFQVELAGSETLRAAQQRPQDYLDLNVRIGGYLVPFTLLGPEAQREVIERAELEW
jgi:formate C-acetyltransferase